MQLFLRFALSHPSQSSSGLNQAPPVANSRARDADFDELDSEPMPLFVLPFTAGISCALAMGAGIRVLLGMRLNLFLVNHDSTVQDQSVIPITTEFKKASLFRVLKFGNWREDVDITLMDYQDRSYAFRVSFHVWKRFQLQLIRADSQVTLSGLKLNEMQTVPARTGAKLEIGDRLFFILVSPKQMGPDLHRDLYREV